MNQEISNFSAFNFSNALNKALEDMKFTTPSPIQAQTIPLMLQGRDAIALAQTGTGKTAAFALPILQNLSPDIPATQALILAPTRELAIQVAEQFELLSKYQRNVTIAVLCGGQEYGRQLKQLRSGAQVVVGTPGRILDHIDKGTLLLNNLQTFILDEADEMLRMGFIEDVETILEKLPEKKQMALFSATMPYRIRQIANTYLNDPASVEIRMETATVKSIEQRFLFASAHQKSDALIRVLEVEDYQGVIVFVRTKSSTEEVAELLQQHGLRAMAIHGDITQSLRERIIVQFKQGAIDILVATDVAARGLDVERVTHVINYDMPHDNETYVHRIGRTGRAGRSGVTVLFVTPKESRLISSIERHTRQRIEKVQVPNDHMIQMARQQRFMSNITARLNHEHVYSYKRIVEEYMKENDVSAVDVAAALALLLHKDMPWKKELNLPKAASAFKEERTRSGEKGLDLRGRFKEERKGFSGDRKGARGSKKDFAKDFSNERKKFNDGRKAVNLEPVAQDLFRIDVGKIHGVKPGNIVGAIANEAGLQSRYITGLKIHEDHSTVRLPKGMPKEVMKDLTKAWVCGRQLNLTLIGSA
ncbi:DEAD/DEAH box helicase [Legionella pneumophila]|uniref:ATP-dependent RNA helicase DeaD n=1 Tax=Legionella pneumophila subsp. pascullei TaxID=91890 RepID=A0AAX2IZ32_LEGPN|nr:DEAD/DEAH box helicase [Legionella pneumophila]AMP89101.1 ATP-dependent RNA helicase [Legionella pneumophila subsp. pascullei]AMP93232.1 RNA helicase [Legionella pneumophila subsp. pascullei]AMP96198.1 RNA helicase [Legionella pneumophila subsp. pascullei]SQG91148.1 ATP-dependent RNA helicase DeaD [Legionella pneumophila subsp. pascullei]VEH07694.1 ATP-dependent RNA helicase DeaD [Legionella pneumophila subsp. pascullei]